MKNTRNITDLLALVVFAAFAVCVLTVLLSGAAVYRNLVRSGAERHTDRTAAQYLATRVHQAQTLSVEPFEDCEALVLREEIDGETYLTRVYCCEGWLRELFCAETAALAPEDGEPILELEQLSFSLADGLLQAELGDRTLFLHVPAGEEVGP